MVSLKLRKIMNVLMILQKICSNILKVLFILKNDLVTVFLIHFFLRKVFLLVIKGYILNFYVKIV